MTSERDGLKAKLKKTELDLEQIKTENQGFREERDRLRRRVGTLVFCTSQQKKGGKFLKKLWCCVGEEYYKIIWFYQLIM